MEARTEVSVSAGTAQQQRAGQIYTNSEGRPCIIRQLCAFRTTVAMELSMKLDQITDVVLYEGDCSLTIYIRFATSQSSYES
jgi:hypothetical protein